MRFIMEYAIEPDVELKNTVVIEIAVTVSGDIFGKRTNNAGVNKNPPPAPTNVPKPPTKTPKMTYSTIFNSNIVKPPYYAISD